jgi:arylsulfatase A-like enzyme
VAADPAYPLDGIDLMPFARGSATPTDRTLFWRQPYPDQSPHAAARRGKWKYLRIGNAESLFDLARDPAEKVNVRDRFPNEFSRLRDAWTQWNAQMVPMPTTVR